MSPSPFSYAITEGIRVTVWPQFLPEHSIPEAGRFVFGYRVRLENVGVEAGRLLRRRWVIHDPLRGDQVVEGEGVIGKQPRLEPGEVHEYGSFCVVAVPHGGWMEGGYRFERDHGRPFEVRIPRFGLDA